MTRREPMHPASPEIAPRNNGSTNATASLKARGTAVVPGIATTGKSDKRQRLESLFTDLDESGAVR